MTAANALAQGVQSGVSLGQLFLSQANSLQERQRLDALSQRQREQSILGSIEAIGDALEMKDRKQQLEIERERASKKFEIELGNAERRKQREEFDLGVQRKLQEKGLGPVGEAEYRRSRNITNDIQDGKAFDQDYGSRVINAQRETAEYNYELGMRDKNLSVADEMLSNGLPPLDDNFNPDNSLLPPINPAQGETTAQVSRYGFEGDGYQNHAATSKGSKHENIGNRSNILEDGTSVALTPEIAKELGIDLKGDEEVEVMIDGQWQSFRVDDTTAKGLSSTAGGSRRIDFFDPSGSRKSIDGSNLTIRKSQGSSRSNQPSSIQAREAAALQKIEQAKIIYSNPSVKNDLDMQNRAVKIAVEGEAELNALKREMGAPPQGEQPQEPTLTFTQQKQVSEAESKYNRLRSLMQQGVLEDDPEYVRLMEDYDSFYSLLKQEGKDVMDIRSEGAEALDQGETSFLQSVLGKPL